MPVLEDIIDNAFPDAPATDIAEILDVERPIPIRDYVFEAKRLELEKARLVRDMERLEKENSLLRRDNDVAWKFITAYEINTPVSAVLKTSRFFESILNKINLRGKDATTTTGGRSRAVGRDGYPTEEAD